MQRNTLFLILATAALGLIMAGPVSAKTTRWTSGDATNPAKWHEANNWNNGIPVAGDTVNIKPLSQPGNYQDPVLSTADGAAGTLTIGSSFTLTVNGVTLTLDGTGTHSISGIMKIDATGKLDVQTGGTFDLDSANTHLIGGEILLSGSGSTLLVSAATTLNPNSGAYGSVIGQDAGASIDIAGVTLTNNIVVKGEMTVQEVSGTAIFLNSTTGVVLANADGGGSPAILLLASDLTIDDDSGAKWQAKGDPDAVLQFASGLTFVDSSPELLGDFVLDDCAKIDVDVNITTNGGLTDMNGSDYSGTLDASAAGVCFDWDGAGTPSKICNSTTSGDC